MPNDEAHSRADALQFLKALRDHLDREITLSEARDWLESKETTKVPGRDIHYEELFVSKFVLQEVSKFLRGETGLRMSETDARLAFRAESRTAKEDKLTSGSPASAQRHLFTKAFGASPEDVAKRWWGGTNKSLGAQSCPDWAFWSPCPYKVVFEAKLFRHGGGQRAKTELVKGIYECCYYRGQPVAKVNNAEWDYDYGCLFAYDVSRDQSLARLWKKSNLCK